MFVCTYFFTGWFRRAIKLLRPGQAGLGTLRSGFLGRQMRRKRISRSLYQRSVVVLQSGFKHFTPWDLPYQVPLCILLNWSDTPFCLSVTKYLDWINRNMVWLVVNIIIFVFFASNLMRTCSKTPNYVKMILYVNCVLNCKYSYIGEKKATICVSINCCTHTLSLFSCSCLCFLVRKSNPG